MLGGVFDPAAKAVLGFWDLICWVVSAWFGIIDFIFGAIGGLLVLVSLFLLFGGQWSLGAVIFAIALFFLVLRDLGSLVSFWLSGEKRPMSPEAFVGDIIGTAVAFVLLFGILFGIWLFLYPVQWLFIVSVALVPIIMLSSITRFIKNFLSVMKSKLGGKQK